MISKDNSNQNINNTAIMMLETKTHKRVQSEAARVAYSKFYGRPIESAQQSRVENVSNNDVTSINVGEATQRPLSNATVSQRQGSDPRRSYVNMNNADHSVINSPSATYGIDKGNGFKSVKFNQVNNKNSTA
jgi:hypothetical protein